MEDPLHVAAPGTVIGCWRYPVKSLQGLGVDHLDIGVDAIAGDRAHALIDVGSGRLLSAKRTASLLHASATDDGIALPGGATVAFDRDDADDVLSSWLGRPVHLASLDEAGQRSYDMTFDPPNDDADYYEIPAPAGTFLDLAAVHLITTATLQGCTDARPDLDWDVRRFRPNLLLDVDGPLFVEGTWAGRELEVGHAVLRIMGPTVRCAMPLRAQPDGLDRQPDLFGAMTELNGTNPNHLGAYAEVATPGVVAVGDPVVLRSGEEALDQGR